MMIHVVVYTHRDGTDVWAHKTKEKALESVISTIKYYLDELQKDDAAKIRDLIDTGVFDVAMSMYQDVHPHMESFKIMSCEVRD